jgi:hypothetical protein
MLDKKKRKEKKKEKKYQTDFAPVNKKASISKFNNIKLN